MKKLLVIPGLIAMVVMLAPLAVFAAADVDEAPIGPDSQADSWFTLDPFTVTAIMTVVIPILTGVLTKATWSSFVKGLITLALSTITQAINIAVTADGAAVFSEQLLKGTVIQFALAVGVYLGLLKPANVTSNPGGKLADVAVK